MWLQIPEFIRPAELDYLRGDAHNLRKDQGGNPKTNFRQLICNMVDEDPKRYK